MKVGIMGGTFDPIHIGHMIAAQCAYEYEGLDEVWFMPTNVPPHKQHAPKATSQQRWDMVCRAVEGQAHFRPFDMELKKGGVSYTYDTVSLLRREYPGIHFYYIIGADMVQYLPKWFKIDELVKLISFIGLGRPGYRLEMESLPALLRPAVQLAEMPQIELSSTAIRQRKAEGKSIKYLVPDRVYEYIEGNGFYGP
ncbi:MULTISPECIES: nicotinate-nucleotide adenylyltransferase [Paenibacillus]|uniref:Probable nicotinate-nucleotide adenylyltransferase n=1 Tax=Paenibacillus radicis (ex Xue et al. 2023) TaxID=2972489 RepID=A0ABT1YE61_9BACL|nr:nicotinate-nucleotide adenylyltransferase [Paenibacillus radicis (ex Xue et al. 2023)]MCR8631479.1 nicotinate-nucleotide adenylyltransferase [Paenibacillus radicis (ex Xue et al. 2023)]